MSKWIFPKDMWVVKIGKQKEIWKGTWEYIEQCYQENKIDEYEVLKVFNTKGDK